MVRPTAPTLSSGLEAWDAEANDAHGVILNAPFPIFEYNGILSAFAVAYPANQYDRCVAAINDTLPGWILVISNGTTWERIPKQAVDPLDLGGTSGGTGTVVVNVTDPADSPATADALRDDLVANAIPDIRNSIAGIQAKINGILAAMRNDAQM